MVSRGNYIKAASTSEQSAVVHGSSDSESEMLVLKLGLKHDVVCDLEIYFLTHNVFDACNHSRGIAQAGGGLSTELISMHPCRNASNSSTISVTCDNEPKSRLVREEQPDMNRPSSTLTCERGLTSSAVRPLHV